MQARNVAGFFRSLAGRARRAMGVPMRRLTTLAALPAIAGLLSACEASSDKYPSLAIRDVERAVGTFTPGGADQTPSPAAAPSTELVARLQQLRENASAAHTEFVNATPGANRLVAAAQGAGVATDRWGDAQVALSDLESLRSNTAIALAEADILYIDASIEFDPNELIGATRAEIISMVADEDVTLAALRGQMRN